MSTTILYENRVTITQGGHQSQRCPDELLTRYNSLVDDQRLSWTEHLRLIKLLGSGGQGVVYLSQRRGADGFTLPVALKDFLAGAIRRRAVVRRGDASDGRRGGEGFADSAG